MAKSVHDITVFVSSTSKDLEDYRAVARNVILELHWRSEMMEHFGTRPESTVEACGKIVEGCDVFLLIVGWRRGWIPPEEQGGNGRDSITALELAAARRKGIPVLALLASATWPGNLWEDDANARQRMKEFRETLNQMAVFFDYEAPTTKEDSRLPSFRAKVSEALLAQKARILENAGVRPGGEGPGLDFFEAARDGLVEGRAVPIVGCGVHGAGVLGSGALAQALCSELPLEDGCSLATVAEYRERFLRSRDQFLRQFHRVIQERSARVRPAPVLDVLAQLDNLKLIVSTTYDQLLEERLLQAGRRVATVAHVLRSWEGENDGRVVVVRSGAKPVICTADHVDTEPDECVIYKPQGSPLLHDVLDPDLELDTVVITETDHATFLRRLENPETGIPSSFARHFRRSPLLFLGYPMDVWQHRLMMQIFQPKEDVKRRAPIHAVRVPHSPVEEVTWKRLEADLIPLELDEFAKRIAESSLAGGHAAGGRDA